MMKLLQSLFTVLRGAGIVGIVILFLYVEWSCMGASFSNLLNLFVQIFILYTLLILPPFWILLGITALGSLGRLIIRRRMERATGKE